MPKSDQINGLYIKFNIKEINDNSFLELLLLFVGSASKEVIQLILHSLTTSSHVYWEILYNCTYLTYILLNLWSSCSGESNYGNAREIQFDLT